jgi:hypothetical protein
LSSRLDSEAGVCAQSPATAKARIGIAAARITKRGNFGWVMVQRKKLKLSLPSCSAQYPTIIGFSYRWDRLRMNVEIGVEIGD